MKPFYAILANGSTAALASPTGAIDWLPVPRFDSDTIFGRLLDKHSGGYLSIEPESYLDVEQSYLDDGLCLETRFKTNNGPVTVRAWMSIGRTALWFQCRSTVSVRLTCRPAFGFGAVRPAYMKTSTGARFFNPKGSELAQLMIQGPFRILHE